MFSHNRAEVLEDSFPLMVVGSQEGRKETHVHNTYIFNRIHL